MTPEDRIHALGIWQGPIEIVPIAGGITNRNYLVRDRAVRRVVRLGEDIPVHHISRQNELAASQAAHAAGLSPAVIHHAPGVLVLDYIESKALLPDDLRRSEMLERVIPLVRACHHDIAREFRGAAAIFWVFHVIRDYIANLEAANSPYRQLFPDLLAKAERLEAAGGPFEIAFGHNDMLEVTNPTRYRGRKPGFPRASTTHCSIAISSISSRSWNRLSDVSRRSKTSA
ncbi:putative choline kinase protein [Rhizobium favelukesii]|uniref:Choline kinase protein n=1 Tax=Rhizobium favelukesii TaxID=348824 RepID=W6R610_9HYPH|nr:putative choline kinase protein [Rhizobium favelukesii]